MKSQSQTSVERSLSGKTEYITTMFNKRTENKNFENFVLNAIYTKIGNLDLKPITQKKVVLRKKDNGEEECTAKIDLFFPQINYAIEVDEGYHFVTEEQKKKDEEREAAIKKALGCKLEHIPCVEQISQNKVRYLEPHKIYERIDTVVDEIKKLLEGKNLVWKTNEDLLAEIQKAQRLDVCSDEKNGYVDYHGPKFIEEELLGVKYNTRKCGINLKNGYTIWVGGERKEVEINGVTYTLGSRNDWQNRLDEEEGLLFEKLPEDDFTNGPKRNTPRKYKELIKEIKSRPVGSYEKQDGEKRIAFLRTKNPLLEKTEICRFIGVFKLIRIYKASDTECYKVSKRIATSITFKELLKGSPVERTKTSPCEK